MEIKHNYLSFGGIRRTLVQDENTPDVVHQYSQQDVTHLVDANAALREQHAPNAVNKLLARVPVTVYEQSLREGWDDADWKKWLNDPDNAAFRVWQGNV